MLRFLAILKSGNNNAFNLFVCYSHRIDGPICCIRNMLDFFRKIIWRMCLFRSANISLHCSTCVCIVSKDHIFWKANPKEGQCTLYNSKLCLPLQMEALCNESSVSVHQSTRLSVKHFFFFIWHWLYTLSQTPCDIFTMLFNSIRLQSRHVGVIVWCDNRNEQLHRIGFVDDIN